MSLTANSGLAVRRGTNGAWVELSDLPAGVAGWNVTDNARTRPVPSIAPVLAFQTLSVRDGNVNFTVDANERTHELMFLRSGFMFQVRVQEAGAGQGKAQVIYTGRANISILNTEAGNRAFNFSLTVTDADDTAQA